MFNIGGNAIEFVRQWPHLDNLIYNICDDNDDILKNAIQYADKLITSYVLLVRWMLLLKTQLLNILYGSLIWNLNHDCIAEVCVAWRKGDPRVWGLPANTHCKRLPVICDSNPFLDVVFCRTRNCINCCLNSSREIVNYVARHGVCFSRIRSPIGSNALHCCQRYGARTNDISIINSGLINRYVRCRYSDELISRASALLELIFVRDHSFN